MKVAVDVSVGRAGVEVLQRLGHEVVVEAEHCEWDRVWFRRALDRGVELVISPDTDIEIMAYDHNVRFFRHKAGVSGVEAVWRALRTHTRI